MVIPTYTRATDVSTLWLLRRAQMSLRKVLAAVHIALAIVGAADTILALRLNVTWGIDDKSVPMP